MKKNLLTVLMMACAIVFLFSSCKKDKVEKSATSDTSQDIQPRFAPGDSLIKNAVTDIDGNTYNAVKLENKVWMAENLRTTRYADGTTIPLGVNGTISMDTAFRYYPNGSNSNVTTYGYLYNWKAIMRNSSSSENDPSGVQGICPDGWHVPSNIEWMKLIDHVRDQSQYVCNNNREYIAKALASTTGWNSSDEEYTPGNNSGSNNATGFNAVPAGDYSGNYFDFGKEAFFWSSTQYFLDYAQVWCIYHDCVNVDFIREHYKACGLSVRCVKD